MQTVQMTLDEVLLKEVDAAARRAGTSRSAFTRAALREALDRLAIKALEEKHREGYRRHPPKPSEFRIWEREQAWGEP